MYHAIYCCIYRGVHNILMILVDDCYDGDVRLVGGVKETEGRVELCSSRRWGTVCDNQWTENHTAVICRHLGFSDVIGSKCKVHT